MAEDKKIKKCPVSLQPDIENLLQDLSPDDFASASRQEKDDFIQDRQSVSYWKDAWRRLKKNVVAMVALGVIVFLFLFAFVGPLLIPYGYDEFNKGAENLYPYHYTLEDTQRVNDEIASRTQSDVVDVDEMIAQAKAEAEKKGEKFTKKDEAVIRAKAKVAAKPSEDSSEEQNVDEDSIRKELGIKKHIFGYSQAELERKANGEKVFPHVFGTDMYGRDILVRVMYGARVSMSVGVFAAILVLVIGALYGAISGYCGGKVDAVMQRIVELIYAVPEMLVVLLIATALKPILTDYVNSSGNQSYEILCQCTWTEPRSPCLLHLVCYTGLP
ncbi:MAG: ABC transporter permease [Ruminococcus sp.]